MTYSITDLNAIDYGNLTLDTNSIYSSQSTNIFTIGGYNGTNATDLTYGRIGIADTNPNAGKLVLKGENADIDINGASLKDFMTRVEERLALLSPNPKLESEWAELKALGDQYRKLEKEIQDKMKTWDILKRE